MHPSYEASDVQQSRFARDQVGSVLVLRQRDPFEYT
jgi:hypothetical protein